MVDAWASSQKTSTKLKILKMEVYFVDEFLNFFRGLWVPFTLLMKSSSGAHIFFVRHYARSGFAPSGQGSAVLI